MKHLADDIVNLLSNFFIVNFHFFIKTCFKLDKVSFYMASAVLGSISFKLVISKSIGPKTWVKNNLSCKE